MDKQQTGSVKMIREEDDAYLNSQFATYLVAKNMRALGFDSQCFGIFEMPEQYLRIVMDNRPLMGEDELKRPKMFQIDHRNSVCPQWAISAPTWQQMVDFFIEKYNLEITVRKANVQRSNYAFAVSKLDEVDQYASPMLPNSPLTMSDDKPYWSREKAYAEAAMYCVRYIQKHKLDPIV